MKETLRIVHLEDSAADAELVERELRKGAFPVEVRRVSTEEGFIQELSRGMPDMILADCSIPGSDSGAALALARGHCPDVPFIFVSGTIREEFAVECLKNGATDYVFKKGLRRLNSAVDRALRESSDRAKRKRAEIALAQSEERYALVLEATNDAVWDWDLERNEVYYSTRWCGMLGVGSRDLRSTPEEWLDRVHAEDLPGLRSQIDSYLKGITPLLAHEHRIRHRDGDYRWVRTRGVALRDGKGTAYRLVGSLSDVTRIKRTEGELKRTAFYDALTGLPNRAFLLDRLGRILRKENFRKGSPFALLLVGLDRFKSINSSLGRRAGDATLVEVARRLAGCLGEHDVLARLDGDTFALLIRTLDEASLEGLLVERVSKTLAPPVTLGSTQTFITATMGMAVGDPRYQTSAEVLEDAETALFRAKAKGRAGFQVFQDGMHESALTILELERDLRLALEENTLVPYFQPIVSLQDGKLEAAEALVRWAHPVRGLVFPGEFIPVAEGCGLQADIDERILRLTAAQIRVWAAQGLTPVGVSVNCSARTLHSKDLPEIVDDTLRETGLSPNLLKLELTESSVMENPEEALAKVTAIEAKGVRILLDDFGTGYSSLAYLRKFPLWALKIDRSFVRDLGSDPGAAMLSETIISMAHRLKLRVVAEGIETNAQGELLRSMGCEYGQGYLYGKPVCGAEFAGLLLKRKTGE